MIPQESWLLLGQEMKYFFLFTHPSIIIQNSFQTWKRLFSQRAVLRRISFSGISSGTLCSSWESSTACKEFYPNTEDWVCSCADTDPRLRWNQSGSDNQYMEAICEYHKVEQYKLHLLVFSSNETDTFVPLQKSREHEHKHISVFKNIQSWPPFLLHFHETKCDMLGNHHLVFKCPVTTV